MNENKKKTIKDSPLDRKYKSKISRNPIILFQKIFYNLKEKNAFKSKRFWITNITILFICLKAYQFTRYINEFSYFIPKEELNRNNIKFKKTELSQMEKKELFEFLDQLEKKKIDRKNAKQENFQNNMDKLKQEKI